MGAGLWVPQGNLQELDFPSQPRIFPIFTAYRGKIKRKTGG